MKSTLLLPSLLLASLCTNAQNTALIWDDVIDCNTAGQGTLRPRIAMNGDGEPVVLWGRTGPMANYVTTGTVSGFTPMVEVSAPGCMPAVADWMGSSIAAAGNTVWVVMKATPEESKPCYVRRSDDGGTTWGDTMRVDPFDGLVSRFPSIDLVDPDAPMVQYMQFDNGWNGARQVVSHMMGGSFMDPVQVSSPYAPGDVCDCCPNQIVTDADHAVALYRNAGPNIRVMWGASSSDGGSTFPVGAVVDTTGWPMSACPSSGPDGYLLGDSIRFVWMSGANNGTKVYLGCALAEDLSLGVQRFVDPTQPTGVQQNFPRIAGSGDTLGVVWENYNNGARDIFFSWSVSGVNGLSAPVAVNTDLIGSQKTPDIAYADGAFHIVWSEYGANQVRYRKGALINSTGIADPAGVASVTAWPNPAHDVLNVQGPWTRAVIMDTQGKLIARMPVKNGSLDVSRLAAGSYSIKFFDRNGGSALTRIEKN